jgi:septum formation protein
MLLRSLREHLARCDDRLHNDRGGGDGGVRGKAIRLILASQSPRRREILDMMGLRGRFVVLPSPVDEAEIQGRLVLEADERRGGRSRPDPPEYARHLACAKALAVAEHVAREPPPRADEATAGAVVEMTIVLGSDTIVEIDGQILEKPTDEQDAERMLAMLSGRRHHVHTGVAMVCVAGSAGPTGCGDGEVVRGAAAITRTVSFVDTATVQFSTLTADDIGAYVSTGEPMDKAGSYGIQGIGGQMVRSIEGDFFTVSPRTPVKDWTHHHHDDF